MTRQKKKIRYDVSDFVPLTAEEWIILPPDKRQEYAAMKQQIDDDAKKKKELEDKLSATRERMTDAQKQLEEFGGDPFSNEYYEHMVTTGKMTREEAEKECSNDIKNGFVKSNHPETRIKNIISDCTKEIRRNEPITDADVIAEMNKRKIAGIEKRKITIERKNQEKLAEERERERRAGMSPEKIEAENKKRLEEDKKEFESRGF